MGWIVRSDNNLALNSAHITALYVEQDGTEWTLNAVMSNSLSYLLSTYSTEQEANNMLALAATANALNV